MEARVLDILYTNSALAPVLIVSFAHAVVLQADSLEDYALDKVTDHNGDVVALLVIYKVVHNIRPLSFFANPFLPSL